MLSRKARKINQQLCGIIFLVPGPYVISKVEFICKKEKRNHFDFIQFSI